MAIGNRKSELPWLNLLFCTMVLWSHCSAHAISNLDQSSWQFLVVYLLQRLSYVSVYGFFLLSGVKLTLPRSHQPSPSAYLGGRLKSIFFPYLLAVALYYLWFVYYLHYFPFSLSDLGGYVLRGDLSSHFYFVIALFQFVLLAPAFKWLSQRWAPALLLPFALGVTWFSAQHLPELLEIFWPQSVFLYTDRVFLTYLFYYLSGCYIGRQYEAFLALLRANQGLILALFVSFTGVNLFFTWLAITGRRIISFLEPLHMLYLLSAILFSFWLAARLPKKLPSWLARVDKASFLIYLYHCLFIFLFNDWANRAGIERISVQFFLRLLFVYTATPMTCVLWQSIRAALIKRASLSLKK